MNAVGETLVLTLIAKPCYQGHIYRSSHDPCTISETTTETPRWIPLFSPVLLPYKHGHPPPENMVVRGTPTKIFVQCMSTIFHIHKICMNPSDTYVMDCHSLSYCVCISQNNPAAVLINKCMGEFVAGHPQNDEKLVQKWWPNSTSNVYINNA